MPLAADQAFDGSRIFDISHPALEMIDGRLVDRSWLYGGMAEGMRSTADLSGLPKLMAAAFLFGNVHSLMPGHGKTVLLPTSC